MGYVQRSADEAEVLTLMAERYERRSLLITSNLVFREWGRIFKSPMTTAAIEPTLQRNGSLLILWRPAAEAATIEHWAWSAA
ncbi:MAG: ATP-binding protein [Sandaracinus sp.]